MHESTNPNAFTDLRQTCIRSEYVKKKLEKISNIPATNVYGVPCDVFPGSPYAHALLPASNGVLKLTSECDTC